MSDKRLLAAAMKRKQTLQKNTCFDAFKLNSRPTEKQLEIMQDTAHRIVYVVAGNQCLAEGTKVLTATGPKSIEDIKIGDTVYSETGDPIKVKNTFSNGRKEVVELKNRYQVLAESTDNHTFLTSNSSSRNKTEVEKKVEDFSRDTTIIRQEVNAPLGNVHEPHAYSLGVFLGDGCSRASGKVISSAEEAPVAAVALELGATKWKKCSSNYSWRIYGSPDCNYYDTWCKGRYAHEKIVDLEVLKTWDRESLLRFVAGVIDTDGSIYIDSFNTLTIRAEMQAHTVIYALQYAFLALWQTEARVSLCERDKYVNGPTSVIKVSNNAYTKRMVLELDPHLHVPHKKWKNSYDLLSAKRTNSRSIGIKKGSRRLVETYDIHVDSDTNLYMLANGLVTHNSGKSTLGGRETSWYFQETHPYWKRPNNRHCHHCKSTDFCAVESESGVEEEYRCNTCAKVWVSWGDEPLTLIVSGKVSKMVTELWEKKIEPFLPKGSYRVSKDGNSLSSVTHTNGNKIIFLSHEKAIKSKDKIQSYVAHFVWIDEMPDHYLYLEEAIQRVTSKLGRLICTFTPKTSNPQVRDMVESVDDRVGTKYKFGKLDNPINQSPEKQELILAELAGVSAAVRNCVLYGDWLDADESVFHFDRSLHCVSLADYNTNMEHVLAYDPAASGKGGLVMAVRRDNGWHVTMASYTSGGKAYSDLILDIDKKTAPFRITRKIYDTHEAAFILEFNKLKKQPGVLKDTEYWTAIKKHGRKRELITNLQQAMLDGWLTFDPKLEDLFNEFTSAQWAEGRDDKIQGSQHYHLLDALQYLIDLLPKKENLKPHLTRDQKIMRAMTASMTEDPKKRTSRIGKRRRR